MVWLHWKLCLLIIAALKLNRFCYTSNLKCDWNMSTWSSELSPKGPAKNVHGESDMSVCWIQRILNELAETITKRGSAEFHIASDIKLYTGISSIQGTNPYHSWFCVMYLFAKFDTMCTADSAWRYIGMMLPWYICVIKNILDLLLHAKVVNFFSTMPYL